MAIPSREQLNEDEDLSATIEDVIVLTWLRLLEPELPRLVKQRHGTELRFHKLASIKPEKSQALPSLLDEVRAVGYAKVMPSACKYLRVQDN